MNDLFGPDAHGSEERCDQVGEGGLTDPAQSKTRQCDAELRRREIGIEILDGVLSSGRSPNPSRTSSCTRVDRTLTIANSAATKKAFRKTRRAAKSK